jgi:serine phosphatase RsbU (regulator of sigma subunit)
MARGAQARCATAPDMARQIGASVKEFAQGTLRDDMCVLVARRSGR